MSESILSGNLNRRVKKYDSEEERQEAELKSYKNMQLKNITVKFVIKLCRCTIILIILKQSFI